MTLKRLLLLFVLLSPLVLYAQASPSLPLVDQTIDDSIQSLEQVEQTLQLYQSNIMQLNKVILSLESDSTASQQELQKQKDLRDSYQFRVNQLQTRYEGLLKTSEKLKSSLQISESFNYILASLVVSELVYIIIQAAIKK